MPRAPTARQRTCVPQVRPRPVRRRRAPVRERPAAGGLRQVYPSISEATTIFQTTLQNGNPVIHPAVTLTNAALLERTAGDFRFYEDGITPAVGRLIQAVDRERLAIAAALGVTILSEPDLGVEQGYMTERNYSTRYSKAPGFLGIKAPDRLASRYLTEDVGYTLVLFTDLARRLGVPTPVMDSIIELTSVVLERDLREQAPAPWRRLAWRGCPTSSCSACKGRLARASSWWTFPAPSAPCTGDGWSAGS